MLQFIYMKLNLKNNSGFTLIELLMVVVIIGILASIVVAVLNSAKGDANDAAIKSEMSSLKTQSELIHSTDGDFDAVCGSNEEDQDANIIQLIEKIDELNGAGSFDCNSDDNTFAFTADLLVNGVLCLDNTESARNVNASDVEYDSVIGGASPALDDTDDTSCN